MTRSTKRILSIMLTIALVFCTVFVFQSSASAAAGASVQIGSYTFSGSVAINSNGYSAVATTRYGIVAGLEVKTTFKYSYGANSATMKTVVATNSNSNTYVSATATRNSTHTLNYKARSALGRHTLHSSYGTNYLDTSVDA